MRQTLQAAIGPCLPIARGSTFPKTFEYTRRQQDRLSHRAFMRRAIGSAVFTYLLSARVFAVEGDTYLFYNASTNELSGYAESEQTWEPVFPFVFPPSCYPDPYWGSWVCDGYEYLGLAVETNIYDPNDILVFSERVDSEWLGDDAQLQFPTMYPYVAGVWSAESEHIVVWYKYLVVCSDFDWEEGVPYGCNYWEPWGVYEEALGWWDDTESEATVNVPEPPAYPPCTTSGTNITAVATMLNWSPLPFERGFKIVCAGGYAVPADLRDSFKQEFGGGYEPSMDPCKVLLSTGFAIAGSHSHPRFTDANEMREGIGCHGRTDWFDEDVPLQNSENITFQDSATGTGDYQWIKPVEDGGTGTPFYLLTPNTTQIKRLDTDEDISTFPDW